MHTIRKKKEQNSVYCSGNVVLSFKNGMFLACDGRTLFIVLQIIL